MSTPQAGRAVSAARTLGALALLGAALPVNLVVTLTALATVRPRRRPTPAHPRTVLVSGGKMTKSLHLCRAFAAAGHRVVLVETAKYRFTGHRYSRSVDAFHVVPSPDDPGYAEALLRIVLDEGVDLYVPVCSPVASRYDALAARVLAGHCEVLHADVDTVDLLDDKYRFTQAAADLGLAVPDTHLVRAPADVSRFDFDAHPHRYVLKNLSYDPVNRLDLTPLPRGTSSATARFAMSKPVTAERPWILQQLLVGQEWCTHTTALDGRMLAYVCCRSSAFQVNYEFENNPAIKDWVSCFIGRMGLTGQISFDFLQDAEGVVRAIECNPRTHSAITAIDDLPALAAAYLGDRGPRDAPLQPDREARPTYWLYHELWRMLARPGAARDRLGVIARGRDAVWDSADPLPFLLLHHLQIPKLLLGNLRRGGTWTRIDFNIGKLVEAGGD